MTSQNPNLQAGLYGVASTFIRRYLLVAVCFIRWNKKSNCSKKKRKEGTRTNLGGSPRELRNSCLKEMPVVTTLG